jgi:hypothetical protein
MLRWAFWTIAAAFALGQLPARAQAWLPNGGTAGYSLEFNETNNRHHYTAKGNETDVGHTRVLTSYLSASYSPSDRWLLIGGLPYVTAKYHGDFPHPGEIDHGGYHGTLTDLRLEAHYQAVTGEFAVAPYAAVVIPVTDYETMGHSAPGRGLHELWIGTYLGRSLDQWLPRTYVQMRLNYAFVEHVAGIRHDRINIDGEIGYFFNTAWSASIVAMWQDTWGGMNMPIPISSPLFIHHDQLAASRFLNVGGSVAWSMSDRIHAYLFYGTDIHGRNAHAMDQSISLGLSFNTSR